MEEKRCSAIKVKRSERRSHEIGVFLSSEIDRERETWKEKGIYLLIALRLSSSWPTHGRCAFV
jgi:hypothetical protein